ncbi:MAG: ATP-binding protein [Cyanobium sp.]
MAAGEPDNLAGGVELPASMDHWDGLFGFVQSEAEVHLGGHAKQYGLMLACEELISNIIRYNDDNTPEGVPISVRIRDQWLDRDGARIFRFEISDNGTPFDPRFERFGDAVDDVPIESRQIGGLGLFLIKSSVDEVNYTHLGHRNVYQLDTVVD